MFGGGQQRQHSRALAIRTDTPPSAEDAFTIVPQSLEAALPISIKWRGWVQLPGSIASTLAGTQLTEDAISRS
jgi:hypothetical protein